MTDEISGETSIDAFITASAFLLDETNKYIPYNYHSFFPALLEDSEYSVEKISAGKGRYRLPDTMAEYKNKPASFFKYSYLRVASEWTDAKGYNLYSDNEYLYFDYSTNQSCHYPVASADTENRFNWTFGNYQNMPPQLRIYNLPEIEGVTLYNEGTDASPVMVVRVPNTVRKIKAFYSKHLFSFTGTTDVTFEGIKFVGVSPWGNGTFEDTTNGAIRLGGTGSEIVNFTMNKCSGDAIMCRYIRKDDSLFGNFTITNCHLICHQEVLRENLESSEYLFDFENNIVEGVADSFTAYTLVGVPRGGLKVENNVVKNISYNGFSFSIAGSRLIDIQGTIAHNEIYDEDEFLTSKPFLLEDGGGIYVCNRSRTKLLTVKDNVVYNLPNIVGVYMDMGCSHVDVIGNLIYNCSPLCIHINGDGNPKQEDPSNPYDQTCDLHINYNIVNGQCRIHSRASDLANASNEFIGNQYFGNVGVPDAWADGSYTFNFNTVEDNEKVDGHILGNTAYMADFQRENHGSLVARRVGNHEKYQNFVNNSQLVLYKRNADHLLLEEELGNAVQLVETNIGTSYVKLMDKYYKFTVVNIDGFTPQVIMECIYDGGTSYPVYLSDIETERFFYYEGALYLKFDPVENGRVLFSGDNLIVYSSGNITFTTVSVGTGADDDIDPADTTPVTALRGSTTVRNAMTLSATQAGFIFYDTDLTKCVLWNGTSWTNLDGTSLT